MILEPKIHLPFTWFLFRVNRAVKTALPGQIGRAEYQGDAQGCFIPGGQRVQFTPDLDSLVIRSRLARAHDVPAGKVRSRRHHGIR
jgi:hypothetical protein